MADYKWPAADKRYLIGKSFTRLDGPAKSSGRAKYAYDANRPAMCHGKMVFSPHAHAKIKSIDTAAAEKMPGVRAVVVMFDVGKEVLWQGQEIVALAADTEEQARDAARAVKIEYEVLPHLVGDVAPEKAGSDHIQAGSEAKEGDPDGAMKSAEVTVEGTYGAAVITHCCMESHGQAAEWNGEKLTVWASSQNVTGIAGELSKALNVPASNVETITQYMGGGFGSKFGADTWGPACAKLSQKAGRPVKMMLERDQELMEAGARPSIYAKVKAGAKKDGTLVAWDSESWGTAGPQSGGNPPIPYVMRAPNRRTKHTAVLTNTGPGRAWRAPNHPQCCVITMGALDDLAAAIPMDPLDFFLKNLEFSGQQAKSYREELLKTAEMIDWKKKWHPRGQLQPGPVQRGLGLSIHTWGGGGHQSNCNCTIHPDGSVEIAIGTQDLGTGTRTIMAIVAGETFGLPISAIQVNIGDSKYPASGASGGSTTVGGVSAATRRATVNALNELLARVAPALNAKPEELEAWDGRIRVAADPSRSMSWQQACAKMGATQMAEVTVDMETGVVRVEQIVAAQDCGLILNMKTAESQVYGALIMGVTYALYEEKLMDEQTGRCLNPDMEFYKLAGLADIGRFKVHMMTGPGYDERGVIGLGEPPVVSPGAAISNAVANAIGVRVPTIPITPAKVLAALESAPAARRA